MKKYNWATLGCGVIANQLAEAMISRFIILILNYDKSRMK